MVDDPATNALCKLYQQVTGVAPTTVVAVRPHASERRIYRLGHNGSSLVGISNTNTQENDTFVYLAQHFKRHALPVPEIFIYDKTAGLYLEDDLGETCLLDTVHASRKVGAIALPETTRSLYRTVLEYLATFQIVAAADLDFKRCISTDPFSSAMLPHDTKQFCGELVARLLPNYRTDRLQKDFSLLIETIAREERDYFLYRDFQARNIMIKENQPYFIDFQSGGRGPLQYDVVSLLHQASAKISEKDRHHLVDHYLNAVSALSPTACDPNVFRRSYPCFVVSRMVQVLGVYGRQGLGAGKEYFRNSIPDALKTLQSTLFSSDLPISLPALKECCNALIPCVQDF